MAKDCNFYKVLIYFLFILSGCNASNDYPNGLLLQENASLQFRIDSLKGIIAELNKTSTELLQRAKDELKTQDLSAASQTIQLLKSRELKPKQSKEVKSLLHLISHSGKASSVPVARKIKKKSLTSESVTGQIPIMAKRKRNLNPSVSQTERIGAMCCDGTRSYATGRGACSHHGGVCQWLYR